MRPDGPFVNGRIPSGQSGLPAEAPMTSPQPRSYRACLAYGAAYTGVFVAVAVGRLLLMEDVGALPVVNLATVIPGLVLAYAAGCLFALPLIWTLRRFRMSPRIPILFWSAAVPVSALGSILGGPLGPPGILLLGGLPVVAALGLAFALQAVWTRRGSAAPDG